MGDGCVQVEIGNSVIGGLLRTDEEDVSERYDLDRLDGVTGVTLRLCVTLVVEDSSEELVLGPEGDVSEEEFRVLEIDFQQVIVMITC